MKYLALLFILFTSPLLGQNKLELRGVYTGENKYVQNPIANDLIHFCADSVKINDSTYTVNLNSSAFKLDLKSLKIPLGDMVTIVIYHKDSCKPKVLNSMAFPPKRSMIRFDSIKVDEEGLLSWKCYNDSAGSRPPLLIEQLKFNRWTKVSEIEQKWRYENNYSTKVELLPGKNIFRINGYSSISDTICINSTKTPVGYSIAPDYKRVIFENTISFELQTEDGLIYSRGEGQSIDLRALKNGNYKICYDNEILKFSVQRKKIHWPQR